MAATNILTTGSGALDSADVVLASGSRMTAGLKGVVDMTAEVRVYLKDDAATYNLVGIMSSASPIAEISAPGTYRFSRSAASGVCGVYSA